jgi:hypothetical protein
VIGGREGEGISEEFPKFFCKCRGELGSSIRDDLFVEAESGVYFVKKKGGNPFCGGCFLGWAENYPLCKAVVDHDQEGIKAGRGREIGDEIAGELLEWSRRGGSDGGKGGYGGVRVCLGLLAISAAFDLFSDVLG